MRGLDLLRNRFNLDIIPPQADSTPEYKNFATAISDYVEDLTRNPEAVKKISNLVEKIKEFAKKDDNTLSAAAIAELTMPRDVYEKRTNEFEKWVPSFKKALFDKGLNPLNFFHDNGTVSITNLFSSFSKAERNWFGAIFQEKTGKSLEDELLKLAEKNEEGLKANWLYKFGGDGRGDLAGDFKVAFEMVSELKFEHNDKAIQKTYQRLAVDKESFGAKYAKYNEIVLEAGDDLSTLMSRAASKPETQDLSHISELLFMDGNTVESLRGIVQLADLSSQQLVRDSVDFKIDHKDDADKINALRILAYFAGYNPKGKTTLDELQKHLNTPAIWQNFLCTDGGKLFERFIINGEKPKTGESDSSYNDFHDLLSNAFEQCYLTYAAQKTSNDNFAAAYLAISPDPRMFKNQLGKKNGDENTNHLGNGVRYAMEKAAEKGDHAARFRAELKTMDLLQDPRLGSKFLLQQAATSNNPADPLAAARLFHGDNSLGHIAYNLAKGDLEAAAKQIWLVKLETRGQMRAERQAKITQEQVKLVGEQEFISLAKAHLNQPQGGPTDPQWTLLQQKVNNLKDKPTENDASVMGAFFGEFEAFLGKEAFSDFAKRLIASRNQILRNFIAGSEADFENNWNKVLGQMGHIFRELVMEEQKAGRPAKVGVANDAVLNEQNKLWSNIGDAELIKQLLSYRDNGPMKNFGNGFGDKMKIPNVEGQPPSLMAQVLSSKPISFANWLCGLQWDSFGKSLSKEEKREIILSQISNMTPAEKLAAFKEYNDLTGNKRNFLDDLKDIAGKDILALAKIWPWQIAPGDGSIDKDNPLVVKDAKTEIQGLVKHFVGGKFLGVMNFNQLSNLWTSDRDICKQLGEHLQNAVATRATDPSMTPEYINALLYQLLWTGPEAKAHQMKVSGILGAGLNVFAFYLTGGTSSLLKQMALNGVTQLGGQVMAGDVDPLSIGFASAGSVVGAGTEWIFDRVGANKFLVDGIANATENVVTNRGHFNLIQWGLNTGMDQFRHEETKTVKETHTVVGDTGNSQTAAGGNTGGTANGSTAGNAAGRSRRQNGSPGTPSGATAASSINNRMTVNELRRIGYGTKNVASYTMARGAVDPSLLVGTNSALLKHNYLVGFQLDG